MDQHEAATADPAGVRANDGQREARRNGSVDGVPTSTQNLDTGL
jgi:hypothetical protein